MIYECQGGHVSFSKDYLNECGMRGCNKSTVMISPINIKWFYKISKKGLSIDRKDLHKIIEDPICQEMLKKK